MAQHDMNIANQGFPATRADINNALQALASNSSGTSAPSTTFANQWWYDTTNNKLYIRNEANNAWIEVAVLDQTANEWQITTGTIKAKDGDGLVFKTDDGTTRINISDAGNVGIGMAPSQLLDLEATDNLSVRFYNSGSFKAGIQVATSAGDMITTTAADDLAIRSQANLLFSSGGNTQHLILDSNGRTGIGVTPLGAAGFTNQLEIGSTNGGMLILTDTNTTSNKRRHFISHPSTTLKFGRLADDGSVTSAIDMQITSDGDVLMGTGSTSVVGNTGADDGFRYDPGGIALQMQSNGHAAAGFNRSQDGDVVEFRSAGVKEGAISISGNTTSYNSFSASHWSRLTDNSKPTILKGTLIETIDEMMDWYEVTFTVPELVKTDDDGNPVADADGNQIIEREESTAVEEIALPSGKSVGDTIDHVYSDTGETLTATIRKSGDNKHTKCKISDTADSTRIYGVFSDWDNDLDDVNDFYVTAVGTHVVRIHSGQTVNAGDLLVSNGDGTAKVQDDDIIRSKTLGKVLTNIKQETYDDGSYTVPCALYCG